MHFKQVISLVFLFIITSSKAQLKVSMIFIDGKEIIDNVLVKEKHLFSSTSENNYKFEKIKELKVYYNTGIEHYYPIGTKRNKKTGKISYGLGMKVYESEYLEIFHVRFHYFKIDQRFKYITKYNPKYDTFIRRKGETYAYSVGCVDGIGCKGIPERVNQFFENCPEVINQIKLQKINPRAIIELADYYNLHCGKD